MSEKHVHIFGITRPVIQLELHLEPEDTCFPKLGNMVDLLAISLYALKFLIMK